MDPIIAILLRSFVKTDSRRLLVTKIQAFERATIMIMY